MMRRRSRTLEGKTAVVTGGTRGVGKALVQELAGRGVRVALCARDPIEVAEVAGELGGGAIGRPVDVSNRISFCEFIDEAESKLGPIDILVNVAGIMPIGPFDDETDSTTQRILDINLAAAVFSTKHVGRGMKARGSGHIVNVASGASWIAGGGGATYCASKFGLLGYCQCVALELNGTGVEISIVAPGVIDTEMAAGVKDIRGLRTVTPQEVAATIIGVLERPRFAAFVPRSIGPMALTFSAIPFGLRHWLARLSRTDTLMLEADTEARAGYEARAQGLDGRTAEARRVSV
jgi:NAD(P)-dependent dehydrogenase (short-subunit alcohol dehydrogenase family)